MISFLNNNFTALFGGFPPSDYQYLNGNLEAITPQTQITKYLKFGVKFRKYQRLKYEPVLEFEGRVRYIRKGHPNMVTQAGMILQN